MEPIRSPAKKWITTSCLLSILVIGVVLITASAKISSPFWKTTLRDVGFVLCPVAVLTLLFQFFAEEHYVNQILGAIRKELSASAKKHNRYIVDRAANKIREQLDRSRKPRFCIHDWSIVELHKNRDSADLFHFFLSAKSTIDICATSLMYLQGVVTLLRDKAIEGIKIRVLALDPESEFVAKRYEEIKFRSSLDFEEELRTALDSFEEEREKLAPDNKANFEVRKFNKLPTVILFRADHRLLVNFILSIARAK